MNAFSIAARDGHKFTSRKALCVFGACFRPFQTLFLIRMVDASATRVFYTSIPVAEAINRSWKFGRAGPCGRPTRPARRRVDRTAVVATAVRVPWSAACEARSNAPAAAAYHVTEAVGAPGALPLHKNRKIGKSRECCCLVHRGEQSADAYYAAALRTFFSVGHRLVWTRESVGSAPRPVGTTETMWRPAVRYRAVPCAS